ncbi:glycosyltransferase family 2 protein [Sutcliffiella deserti]|uniref:glycosyltransferase family 2 protein n=1 Tax=Sutcliffiella deserti TaxID=2875501 RepID=UPI001CBAB56A|nr:glycosyltransferase [Sutcliffiella deserti]
MYKVSVIIPTHNRPNLLLLALQSIDKQYVKPDEVIVVIDGENEETERFLNGFQCTYNLTVKKIKESKGACYARNLGAEAASGDLLMFLDDDDLWEPKKIKSQLEIFNQQPEVGLVYTGKLVVYNTNRQKVIRRIPAKVSGDLFPKILEDNYIGTTSSVALKKSVFVEAGGFDNNLPTMQDYDLWIRCCKISKVAHDKEYNIKYTISKNASSQISGRSENHHRALKYLFKKYGTILDENERHLKRRFKSSRFLHCSKAVHRTSYFYSLKYSWKSFFHYPNVKAAALFLPPFLLRYVSFFDNIKRK